MNPLKFEPLLKRSRWGGRRLGTVLDKPIGPEADYAESWEISDHGSDQTRVVCGIERGQTLNDLVSSRGCEIFGCSRDFERFPLLAKFLDCQDRLSVQVHPTDELARSFYGERNGKSEAWVIMDAVPGSVLYAGFKHDVQEKDLLAALDRGCIECLLNKVEVHPGDVFEIPAGTVHALGEGILLAEVQQSSNLTFRLFDWNRTDANGNRRELHVTEALRCTDFNAGPVLPTAPRTVTRTPGFHHEKLVSNRYFSMERMTLSKQSTLNPAPQCRILSVLSGSGMLAAEDDEYVLPMGESLLIPASCGAVELFPKPGTEWQILLSSIA